MLRNSVDFEGTINVQQQPRVAQNGESHRASAATPQTRSATPMQPVKTSARTIRNQNRSGKSDKLSASKKGLTADSAIPLGNDETVASF